jgi:PBP1b-binding outer membrane lipoprotein LpoB
MKKILIAALFAALLFPSCGDDDNDEPTPQNNNPENVTPDTPGND